MHHRATISHSLGRSVQRFACVVTVAALASCVAPVGLQSSRQVDPRLVEVTLTTGAVRSPTHVRILLPAGYDPNGAQRYPVLYLLQGGAGSYLDWTTAGQAEQLTANLPLIVVMPDGGGAGWYSDWYNNSAGGPHLWETYHIGQLIPWIDNHYRTVSGREGRAIAGLSMGGFGAMSYAARHPDLFVAAASFSGALDTAVPPESTGFFEGISGLDGGPPGAIWGLRSTDAIRWRAHNPRDLAENLRGLELVVRTGNGEPGGPFGGSGGFESAVHPGNVTFNQRLVELGIPHLFDDYGPGAHSWPYWNRDLAETLPILMDTFARPPAPPSPFTFNAVDSTYGVYGWHVSIERPALEFSQLANASAAGFSLSGSGTGTVLTAPLYRPGATYQVVLRGESGSQTEPIVATAQGQLLITVPLGPGNPYQQDTQQALANGGTVVHTARVTITG